MNLVNKYSTTLGVLVFMFLSSHMLDAQRYNSLVGVRAGIETVEFSAKLSMDKRNALEGTVGIVTPQPDYTVGAGVAYHRHFPLNESESAQFYVGVGGKAVFGDESALGAGPQFGFVFIWKSINIGVDALPTYFFDDVLEFRPIFGVHLRYVND